MEMDTVDGVVPVSVIHVFILLMNPHIFFFFFFLFLKDFNSAADVQANLAVHLKSKNTVSYDYLKGPV